MELFRLFGTIAINNDAANNAIDETTEHAQNSENKMIGAFKRIGAAVAAAFAVDKIIEFGKSITEAAASVAAEQSAFEQIMGDYVDKATVKVGEIADATGMIDARLTPYMTSMTAKFKGLGFDIDDATSLAKDGLMLAADASAFWDKSLEDSMGALNSFVNGSYEGGEAIGLFANETQMAQYAIKTGLVETTAQWQNLDEATKQATRLEYAKAMFEQSGATGQAAKESEQYANVQANLAEKWRQFKAEIGEPFLENVVLPVMQKLSDLVDILSENFKSASEWLKENKDTLIILGEVITTVTAGIVAYNLAVTGMTIVRTITTALQGMTIAQYALNLAMSLNPIGIVIALVAALVAAFIYLWNNSESFRNFWIDLWDGIKEVAGVVVDALVTFFTETIPDALSSMVDWFSEKIDAISEFFSDLRDDVSDAWDTITNAIDVAIMFVSKIIETAFDLITLPWRFIWENVKEYVFAAWDWIKNTVSNALGDTGKTISEKWEGIKTATTEKLGKIGDTISSKWKSFKDTISSNASNAAGTVSEKWNTIKENSDKVFNDIKTAASKKWNEIKSTVGKYADAIKTNVSGKWNDIKDSVSTVTEAMRKTVGDKWNAIKNSVSTYLNPIKSTVSNIFGNVKSTISNLIDSAATSVRNGINKIKSYFNFSWSLPKLKLPHFNINGKFSLNPPSVPDFSIKWYKKGGILNEPTLFDYNPQTGQASVGGEAGAEAIAPIDTLMGYVRTAVKDENASVQYYLEKLIALLADYFPQVLSNMQYNIVLDNGALVGQLAPQLDRSLGDLNELRKRGK